MVQVYSTLASAIWWFMLTISLFWKLWFPFNARLRESKRQIKYIHLGCVLIGVLVPLIPIIGLMSDFAARVNSSTSNLTFVDGGMGFTSIRFPPVPCNGNSKALVFYTNILPTNIILAVGINIIILIFWLVHKVSCLTLTRASNSTLDYNFSLLSFSFFLPFLFFIPPPYSFSLFPHPRYTATLIIQSKSAEEEPFWYQHGRAQVTHRVLLLRHLNRHQLDRVLRVCFPF